MQPVDADSFLKRAAAVLGEFMELVDVFRTVADDDDTPLVARCRVGGGATVVVKTPRRWKQYVPDEPGGPADGTLTEWAALELLGEIGFDGAPRLVAADRESGILILSDVGQGARLDHVLLGSGREEALDALRLFGRSLGELHVATSQVDESQWLKTRSRLGPVLEMPVGWLDDVIEEFVKACAAWDVDASVGRGDLNELAVAWRGKVLPTALTHGDPCPDNVILRDDHAALIDFEVARVAPAVRDASYGHVPFPTCWCIGRLPEDATLQFERAYVAASGYALPELKRDLAFACAFWFISTTPRIIRRMADQDDLWGTYGQRARLPLRADSFSLQARAGGVLQGLVDVAGELAKAARVRWGSDVSMDLYPALR